MGDIKKYNEFLNEGLVTNILIGFFLYKFLKGLIKDIKYRKYKKVLFKHIKEIEDILKNTQKTDKLTVIKGVIELNDKIVFKVFPLGRYILHKDTKILSINDLNENIPLDNTQYSTLYTELKKIT